MRTIDLRSDTVTLPTPDMLEFMMHAPVGDDGRAKGCKGEDPTAAEAEAYVAELFGKEDALYVPSGTMGNMVCVATHCRRGEKAVTALNMHMYKAEKGIFNPDLCGVEAVCLPHERGAYRLDALEQRLREGDIKLVCLENSYNFEGGCVIPRDKMEGILELCARYGATTHLDGARIFNAACALGISVKELTAGVDSVQFCVSKGLSAPIGSFVAGSRAFIERARETRKMLGGQLRQVGILAGGGLYAVKHLSQRVAHDNARARRLAEGIQDARGISIEMDTVQTNIVKVDLHGDLRGRAWLKALEECEQVRAHYITDDSIRLVTYRGITDEDIDEAVLRIRRFCETH